MKTQRVTSWRRSACRFLSTTMLVVLSYASTGPIAAAQWVVTDPSNLVQNTISAVQAVRQIAQQVQQVQHEIEMLKTLSAPPWRRIDALIGQVDNLMRQGNALGYSTSNLLRQFGITFPGFQAYLNWSAQQQRQFERTLYTYRNVMASLQSMARQFPQSHAELVRIKSRMSGITGQTGAVELGNTLVAFSAEELIMIRQLLTAQTNAIAVQAAYEANRDAQLQATRQLVYDGLGTYTPASGRGFTGTLAEDD